MMPPFGINNHVHGGKFGQRKGRFHQNVAHTGDNCALESLIFTDMLQNRIELDAEGNVINIIDQRVWKLTPLFFSYTISKSALWTATRTLAQALAPRIRVNAIGPGPALQSIHQTDDQFREQSEATPLIRGTTPEEIANAINFILDAPAMTGQMIALDGGQHLAWQTADVAHDA